MLPGFGSLRFDDRNVETFQANVAAALLRLIGKNGNPVLDFSRITGVKLSVGSNVIQHKLGRQILGWFPTDINAICTLFRTAWSTTTITLTASAIATADFYFF